MKKSVFLKKLAAFSSNMPIRKHMLLYFLLLCFVLIACMTWFFTSTLMENMSQKTLEATSQLVEFMGTTIGGRFTEANRVGNLAMQQEIIGEMMETTAHGLDYPMKRQLSDEREVTDFLSSLEYSNNLVRVRLLLKGSPIYINENIHYFSLSEDILAQAKANLGVVCWLKAQEFPYIFQQTRHVITLYRPVRSDRDFSTIIGVVAVDIAMSEIAGQLSALLDGEDAAVMLVDSQGHPVLSLGNEALLPEDYTVEGAWKKEENTWNYAVSLEEWGWKLVYACTQDKIASAGNAMMLDIMTGVAFLMGAACVLSIITSFFSTRRIRRLASVMDRVQAGETDRRVPEDGGSELGVLEHSFNHLLDTLDETLESKIQDRMALQRAEVRLLHAQIQPHFLYNTLDLVNWRLMQSGDQKGSELVKKLARFYKLGLSHGKDQIPLRDELEHARLYTEIQAFRLGDFVDVRFDVPPELMNYPMTGNILQPLIENSILHGVRERKGGRGEVVITARQEEGGLLLQVADNGGGVDVEKMEALMNAPETTDHYGVWSIHKRLRLTYGPWAGLSYKNRPEGGTIVEIRLGRTET